MDLEVVIQGFGSVRESAATGKETQAPICYPQRVATIEVVVVDLPSSNCLWSL
jgi:hypothetical protein